MNNQDTAPLARTEQRPGYFWADNELMDVYGPKIGAYGIAVYMTLCRFANNKTGHCQVRIKTIANRLNVSSRTVQRALKALTDHGLVMIEASIVEKNGARVNDANIFTILAIEKNPHDSQTPPVLKTPPPCQIDTPLVTVGHTNNKTHENKTEINKRGQAPPLPLIGLVPSQPTKPEQPDGRKRESRKPGHPQAADDPALVAFRDRLKAHRESTLGAPSGAQYFTQEAAGIKTLWGKINASQITENDCVELFNLKLNQWRGRGMSGHLPNWLYVSQDIEPYVKNRNVMPLPVSRSGFVSQAEINQPRGRVVL